MQRLGFVDRGVNHDVLAENSRKDPKELDRPPEKVIPARVAANEARGHTVNRHEPLAVEVVGVPNVAVAVDLQPSHAIETELVLVGGSVVHDDTGERVAPAPFNGHVERVVAVDPRIKDGSIARPIAQPKEHLGSHTRDVGDTDDRAKLCRKAVERGQRE